MLWFYKVLGTGPSSTIVRDGKLTAEGEHTVFRLRAVKARRGRLTPKAKAQLEELSTCPPLHAGKDYAAA
jgi:hypothetical protein